MLAVEMVKMVVAIWVKGDTRVEVKGDDAFCWLGDRCLLN